MDDAAFKKMMIADEGERLKAYTDTKGKTTVGIGRNLTDSGLRQIESDFLFANDLAGIRAALNTAIPWWNALTNNRQMVLANIAFNVGVHGLLGFKAALAATRVGNFVEAAAEILDSDAARELPARYHRLAVAMTKG